MKIHLATHYGMCFGVRDALRATHDIATRTPVTVLGQLVHNPVVDQHLRTLGVQTGALDAASAPTDHVVITAHGASDHDRARWSRAGYAMTDTTCPLVRKAHDALGLLANSGYLPVIIGQAEHAEVRGLAGDHPEAVIILDAADVQRIPFRAKLGVIAQTTQPVARVLALVDMIKRRHPAAEVRFIDTVCRPTKQRQTALEDLCARCDTVVVIGGRNSNNTRQLVESATRLGAKALQVERATELDAKWFRDSEDIGVTAGTSTLDETVQAVVLRLQQIAAEASQRWSLRHLLPA
jgi:4-hydroxy-3-methylbut-2-en-1-yl diphosphate reductase